MTDRGGNQRIPRPASARAGRAPAWAHVEPADRRFSLADVRTAALTSAAPRRVEAPSTARPAAVLVAFFEEEDEARVILTKRPETMPSHQGEIAFPGGKFEPGVDRNLKDTALREAHEEIGLDPAQVEVVAELTSMTTVAGRFVLAPFVGLLDRRPVLAPDFSEVVSVFDVSISELLDDAAYREERWDLPVALGPVALGPVALGPEAGLDRPIHFFELPGETVWGATARILADFLEHLVVIGR